MDNFIGEFTKRCKVEVLKYGFRQKKNVFGRIVDDVYQNFYIEKLRLTPDERRCRVGFAVVPLCQRLTENQISDGMGIYYLRKFEVSHWMDGDGWRYKVSSEDISVCVDEIISFINKYLLPFFERANSCKTALPEAIALEKLFNETRKESLRQNGMEDKAGSYVDLNLLDSAKYYMALKSGDFDFALKSRMALLQQNVDSYNSMKERGYLTEEDRMRREKKLAVLRSEISKIEGRDETYIQQLIIKNEEYSRECLQNIM